MNLKKLKKLVEKWIKGSQEKQLKVFTQNKQTTRLFKQIINEPSIK